MIGQYQSIVLRPGGDQHPAQQRGTSRIEPGCPVGRQQQLPLAFERTVIEPGQVEFRPDSLDILLDYLHRPDLGVEGGAQIRMSVQQHLSGSAQPLRIDLSAQLEYQLCQVGVYRLHGQQRVEQQPLLQRRQRPDVAQRRVPALESLDFGLPESDQIQIRWRPSPATSIAGMGSQGGQCPRPRVRCRRYFVGGEHLGRIGPDGSQSRPVPVVAGAGFDVEHRRYRHIRIPHTGEFATVHRQPSDRRCPFGKPRGDPAGVVECDLRRRQSVERGAGVLVEVPQQAVADPVVRDGDKLLLDGLDRCAHGRPARARVVDINVRQIQTHRETRSESAESPRQVRARDDAFLPAVTLETDHDIRQPIGFRLPCTPPLRHRQCQRGQQPVAHLAVECRGHLGQ